MISEKVFSKRLTPSEVARHCIRINKESRALFLEAQKSFTVIVGNKRIEMIIDNYDRIRFLYCDWSVFTDLLNFVEGDTVVFYKNSDGTFNLSVKKP